MSNWIVQERATGAVAYAYTADQADHFDDYPLETYNHVRQVDIIETQPSRLVSKIAYLRRFTVAERVAIRTAAAQNAILADYLSLLELASEVDLDDHDTIGAVHMLEQAGLIAAGRAADVLA